MLKRIRGVQKKYNEVKKEEKKILLEFQKELKELGEYLGREIFWETTEGDVSTFRAEYPNCHFPKELGRLEFRGDTMVTPSYTYTDSYKKPSYLSVNVTFEKLPNLRFEAKLPVESLKDNKLISREVNYEFVWGDERTSAKTIIYRGSYKSKE